MMVLPSPRPVGAPRSSLLSGLVAYWKLEEASGTRVDQLGTYNLTAVNTPGNAAGKIGNGCAFVAASSQYLTNTSLQSAGLGKICIAFWANRSNAATDFVTIGWVITTHSVFCITVSTDGNVYVECDGAALSIYASAADGLTGWRHYVMVYDGTQTGDANRFKLYRGGSQVSLSAWSASVPATFTTTDPFRIGRDQLNARFTNAIIDEVGVWTGVALTSTQVSNLYNGGTGVTYPFTGVP